jgi:flagellar hook-basal body complex protein FliE
MAVADLSTAISAYKAVARAASGGDMADAAASTGSKGDVVSDFASMVQKGLQSAIDTGRKSETLSEQAIAGKADIRDVAAAVNNAETTLQTVVAIRDKVIQAYNQIIQMPI